jgi:hypothetical protein
MKKSNQEPISGTIISDLADFMCRLHCDCSAIFETRATAIADRLSRGVTCHPRHPYRPSFFFFPVHCPTAAP